MSFDVYLRSVAKDKCPTCGHEEKGGDTLYDFNLTHNVNEIVDRCLVAGGATRAKPVEGVDTYYAERSWGRLDGWMAYEVTPILERAYEVALSTEREAEFRALEPENRWGTLDVTREVFREFLDACRALPNTIIVTSG